MKTTLLIPLLFLLACDYHPRIVTISKDLGSVYHDFAPQLASGTRSVECGPGLRCMLDQQANVTVIDPHGKHLPSVKQLQDIEPGYIQNLRVSGDIAVYKTFDGRLYYQGANARPLLVSKSSHPALSPDLDENGLVYVDRDSCISYREFNGATTWQKCLGMSVSQLLLSRAHVFVGSQMGKVLALDRMSGEHLWEFNTNGLNIKLTSAARLLLVGADGDGVYGIETTSGNAEWHTAYSQQIYEMLTTASTLVLRDRLGTLSAFQSDSGLPLGRAELGLRSPDIIKLE